MITITFAAWMIPAAITVIAIVWALFIVDGGNGMFAGLYNVYCLIPALAISMIAWIIYAFLK